MHSRLFPLAESAQPTMAPDFFVQGVAVLFRQAPFDPDLHAVLTPLGATPREGTAQNLHALSWVIPLSAETQGAVLIDVLPRPWPDAMGNQETDPITFLARGVGAFGPGAWPGGLARASRGAPEKDAATIVNQHRGVLRIRVSYQLDSSIAPTNPSLMKQRNAAVEVRAILEVARALLSMPGALAFYNPNAEVIASPSAFLRGMEVAGDLRFPWPFVVSIRHLALHSSEGAWLFDTLGLSSQFRTSQLPLLDHEILWKENRDPRVAERFLRGLVATAMHRGNDWQPEEEVEGPDGTPWNAERQEEALLTPPRPVWRWAPVTSRSPA